MKPITKYIGIHKQRGIKLFFGILTLCSIAIVLLVIFGHNVIMDSKTVLTLSLVPSIVFLPAMLFYTVMIVSDLYAVHTQFSVSRRSGLTALLSFLLLMTMIVSVLTLLLEAEFGLVFKLEFFGYKYLSFADLMRITNGIGSVIDIVKVFLVQMMVYLMPVCGALMLIVPGMFLSGRVLAAVYGSIYLIFMICMTFGKKLFTPIWTALESAAGRSGAFVVVMLGFEIIVLTTMSILYLRTNWKERHITA